MLSEPLNQMILRLNDAAITRELSNESNLHDVQRTVFIFRIRISWVSHAVDICPVSALFLSRCVTLPFFFPPAA
jgi:hypothetical protein